jgi:hypothetical protein
VNPDDIIKVAPEIAKVAGPLAAAIPFTAIVKRMLGPAADELAERWRDKVRIYRYGRQIQCLKKAEKMATDAGFTPKAVPIKILFPLLEGASLEENDDLHTMWAALLANSSSPNAEKVRPGFIAILRQLSHEEAKLLNCIYDVIGATGGAMAAADLALIPEVKTLDVSIDGLEASQLVRALDMVVPSYAAASSGLFNRRFSMPVRELYGLTSRGVAFIAACRAPKPAKVE